MAVMEIGTETRIEVMVWAEMETIMEMLTLETEIMETKMEEGTEVMV